MKKILIAAIAMLSLNTIKAQVSGATLTASGLTCSMCSRAVYSALIKVNTIESIKANINESSYNIVFKKDAVVNFDDLLKAVEGAGFSVAKLLANVTFNNVAINNDAETVVGGINFRFLNVPGQTLNGEKILTIVDKHFVPEKEYKKYGQYTTSKDFASGMDETGNRVYHVTII